jgi:hypothetical protein
VALLQIHLFLFKVELDDSKIVMVVKASLISYYKFAAFNFLHLKVFHPFRL